MDNVISKASDIIRGHANELFGINEELAIERIEICEACPICVQSAFGPMCDHDKWIHPETEDVLLFPKDGYVRGCGCRLSAKTTLRDNHCIINKW
jgi:hypothetical protein